MRLPPNHRLDRNAASKAERYQLGWVLWGPAGRMEAPCWGLGIIWAVLDWPLNGGMKAIISLCTMCLCRLGTALW